MALGDRRPLALVQAVRDRDRITIRRATGDDGPALARLAALAGRLAPAGALLAEVDGDLLVALPLDGGEPIADPFRATADVAALLRVRAAQLDDAA